LDRAQFEHALREFIAELRRKDYLVEFDGFVLEMLGYSAPQALSAMRNKLAEDINVAAQTLCNEAGPYPSNAVLGAIKQLERFGQNIKAAPDKLMRRVVAASHDDEFPEAWEQQLQRWQQGSTKMGQNYSLDSIRDALWPVEV
jgi:hypothetical protein